MLDDSLPAIRHPNSHLRGSLVCGALASQKPSPGTSFACGESRPWRVRGPLYQHSSSAAGKQWLPQDGFELFELCADQISRLVDYDDYTIKDDVFAYIDEAWGPHTIDRVIIARNLVG